MKKVIGGARYDSDRARRLAHWEVGDIVARSDYYEETLYLTRSGRYFIHGAGGPRTPYGRVCSSDGLVSGERIVPITEEQARALVEEHCDGDEYETIFGAIEEGRVKRTIYLSPPASAHLEALKDLKQMSVHQVVDKAIMAYYAEEVKSVAGDNDLKK